jgi:hypothetical protein
MAIYLFNVKTFVFFPSFVVPPLMKREGLDFFIIGVPLLHLISSEICSLMHSVFICFAYRLGDTESNSSSYHCQENDPAFALRINVYLAVVIKTCLQWSPSNAVSTAVIVAETWLPSRCLAMDARSDFDIPTYVARHSFIKFSSETARKVPLEKPGVYVTIILK